MLSRSSVVLHSVALQKKRKECKPLIHCFVRLQVKKRPSKCIYINAYIKRLIDPVGHVFKSSSESCNYYLSFQDIKHL